MEDEQVVKMLSAAGVPRRWQDKTRGLVTTFAGDDKARPLVEWMEDKKRMTGDEPTVVRIEGGGAKGMDLGYAVARALVVRGNAVKVLPLCQLRSMVEQRNENDDWHELLRHRTLVLQGADDGKEAMDRDDWYLDWVLVEWLTSNRNLVLVSDGDMTEREGWSRRFRDLIREHTAVAVTLDKPAAKTLKVVVPRS